MATDMLRLAGESDGFQSKMPSTGGSGAKPSRRPVPADAVRLPDIRSIDMRAVVARAVIPKLREALKGKVGSTRHPLLAPSTVPSGEAARRLRRGGGHVNAGQGEICRDEVCRDEICHDDTGRAVGGEMQDRDEHIGELIDGLLRDDLAGVCRRIDAVRACGRPLERVYVDLLAPAAVGLSRLLAEDLCSSAAGTLAFCNLQLVLRRYASEFYGEGQPAESGRRALLVSPQAGADALQGLQVFGLLLTADFLRREGWDAWTERSFRSASFKEALTQWFDLVEVLATDHDDLEEVASGIRCIRRGSVNPHVGIVACGRIFVEHPEYARLVGADHAISDPLSVLPHLNQLAKRQLRRPS